MFCSLSCFFVIVWLVGADPLSERATFTGCSGFGRATLGISQRCAALIERLEDITAVCRRKAGRQTFSSRSLSTLFLSLTIGDRVIGRNGLAERALAGAVGGGSDVRSSQHRQSLD